MRVFITSFMLLAYIACVGQGYNVVGDAYGIGGNCYVLTPAVAWRKGAVWSQTMIHLNHPFHLQFTANFGNSDAGADGLVFAFQRAGAQALGSDGEMLGIGGMSPSVGVEFDIFQNQNLADPSADHVGVVVNGNLNHASPFSIGFPVQASATGANIEDGQDHVVDIIWDPSSFSLRMRFDCVERIAETVDLVSLIFGGNPMVYWGFTGSTGGASAPLKVCIHAAVVSVPELVQTCANEPIVLPATGTGSGTYSWEPATFLSNPNALNPIATVKESTTFYLTYSDLCGGTTTDSIYVYVADPLTYLKPLHPLCELGPLEVSLNPNYSVLWNDGSSAASRSLNQPGLYWIEAINGNCSRTDTVLVTLGNPSASAAIIVAPLTGAAPLEVELQNLSPFAENAHYIIDGTWYPTNTTAYLFTEPGTYEIALIVWNHHPLCADTARVTVVVDFDVEIMIPNVLTPNGDGQNDAFAITTRGVTMAALEVHNRWGNVVLSTGEKALQDGINNLWRPEGLSDGVYFYTLQYADAFGRRRTRSGHITLLK